MLTKFGKFKRRLIRRFSRTHLISRWLGYDTDVPESHAPGLIILQVDGLSRNQFEAAVANKRLPFLKKMIDRHYFERTSFYSGVPSCTPAVQAEVMYGVKGAVPAFQFLHRRSGQILSMYEHDAARQIVDDALDEAEPLLKGGASYSNIYSGGSEEARCCAETADLASTFKGISPPRLILLLFLYSFTLVRIAALAVVEVVVALGDMVRGLMTSRDWRNEIKFVPARVLVSIVLREWVRIAVKLAIVRGTPVIYSNLLGYDEQAHRRGPASAFAHWGLKGIDRVIKDIFETARRSDARDYELLVFSDHGQEAVQIYEFEHEKTVQEAVADALKDGPLGQRIVRNVNRAVKHGSYMDQNMRRLLKIKRGRITVGPLSADDLAEHVIVTAMGPIGHVYFPVPILDEAKAEAADRLVNQQSVPLVVYKLESGQVMARNARGLWNLAEDADAVCGVHHRFATEVQEDLAALCDSPNVGDLILCGWDPEKPPLTFVHENGAHGSIGSQETRGFALLPTALSIPPRQNSGGEAYVRGVDLHNAGLAWLQGHRKPEKSRRAATRSRGRQRRANQLRLMTYNTHHCIGMDGKCRPQRIAKVIAAAEADVVALQELDINRARTNFRDQSADIASQLGMYHRFFPVWTGNEEHYGLSVLSRLPITSVKEDLLTAANPRSRCEARGAIWVTVETDDGPVHLINTHLGLRAKERLKQVNELLSERWLGELATKEPVILCGDFNAGPKSQVMQRLTTRLHDAQDIADDHRPQSTFASVLPLRRIDYILLSRHFAVESACVVKNHATSVASDHLPVLAEVSIHRDITPLRADVLVNRERVSQPLSRGRELPVLEPINGGKS